MTEQTKVIEHPSLAAALVAALADLTVVEKSRTAKIDSQKGRSFSYEYADLGDVVKLTRPVLASHGIVVLTPIEEHGNGLKCTVVFLHASGERMDFGPFPFPHGQDAQATGSLVTYYRRYALVAALGMAAGDDDDGATAHAKQEPADVAVCTTCGAEIEGARSDKEPMRAHKVEAHGWTREADGTVSPPPRGTEQLDVALAIADASLDGPVGGA